MRTIPARSTDLRADGSRTALSQEPPKRPVTPYENTYIMDGPEKKFSKKQVCRARLRWLGVVVRVPRWLPDRLVGGRAGQGKREPQTY